jgi:hypothetical protein
LLALAFLFLVAGYFFITQSPKTKQKEPISLADKLEFARFLICSDTDALQMWIQDPNSTRPIVLRLKKNIALYNKIVEEMPEEKPFSPALCQAT